LLSAWRSLTTLTGARSADEVGAFHSEDFELIEADQLKAIFRLGLISLQESNHFGRFRIAEPSQIQSRLEELQKLEVLEALTYVGLSDISVDQLLIECDRSSQQYLLTLLIIGEVFDLYQVVTGVEYDVERYLDKGGFETSKAFMNLAHSYLDWCKSQRTS
jgi:hypothetical protein